VVERLNPLLYMREVQISTLGPDVVYPDWGFSWFPLVAQGKCWDVATTQATSPTLYLLQSEQKGGGAEGEQVRKCKHTVSILARSPYFYFWPSQMAPVTSESMTFAWSQCLVTICPNDDVITEDSQAWLRGWLGIPHAVILHPVSRACMSSYKVPVIVRF
jgi:hypothetical protein